jgi:hypothetical protein
MPQAKRSYPSYPERDQRITKLYAWLSGESLRLAAEAGVTDDASARRELLERALAHRAAARRIAAVEEHHWLARAARA